MELGLAMEGSTSRQASGATRACSGACAVGGHPRFQGPALSGPFLSRQLGGFSRLLTRVFGDQVPPTVRSVSSPVASSGPMCNLLAFTSFDRAVTRLGEFNAAEG
jgi:hypothetical protein